MVNRAFTFLPPSIRCFSALPGFLPSYSITAGECISIYLNVFCIMNSFVSHWCVTSKVSSRYEINWLFLTYVPVIFCICIMYLCLILLQRDKRVSVAKTYLYFRFFNTVTVGVYDEKHWVEQSSWKAASWSFVQESQCVLRNSWYVTMVTRYRHWTASLAKEIRSTFSERPYAPFANLRLRPR
jgi:hypothetical protein